MLIYFLADYTTFIKSANVCFWCANLSSILEVPFPLFVIMTYNIKDECFICTFTISHSY